MENLFTFLKLIFLFKTILITPSPITLGSEWVVLKFEEPVKAITGGAAIYVDVSQYVEGSGFAAERFKAVDARFPPGVVEGELITVNGEPIFLKSSGASLGKDSVWLIVTSDGPLPVGVKFVEVRLRSKDPLEDINVYWKNGLH